MNSENIYKKKGHRRERTERCPARHGGLWKRLTTLNRSQNWLAREIGVSPGYMPPEASPDSPVVSYTPEQQRMFRNGLRIWARVAIRSYMRKHGAALSLPEDAPDGSGEVE